MQRENLIAVSPDVYWCKCYIHFVTGKFETCGTCQAVEANRTDPNREMRKRIFIIGAVLMALCVAVAIVRVMK